MLFRKYFEPSLPNTFEIQRSLLEIHGSGDFRTPEFLRCICSKVDLILESLQQNAGEIVVWSDVDIRFFDITPEILTACLGEHDIVFQREGHKDTDINCGFFVCRCTNRLSKFFEMVKEGLLQDPVANDQMIINRLLSNASLDLLWAYLPFSFYARTHGWPPPQKLALYHANATMGRSGIAQKEQQFRELSVLRRFGVAGLIATSVKHIPKRVGRLLSERNKKRNRLA